MRVIAGKARSLPLKTPEGIDTRPTTDRVKETLFNMLQPYVPEGVFVDLFSGSGGIGVEALSRGAERCYFVENDRRALACIEENLSFTKLLDFAIVLKQDVFAALGGIRETFVDVIFMDPPYGKGYEKEVFVILKEMPYVTEQTLLVVEADLKTDFSWTEALGFTIIKEKRYKTNRHLFMKRRQAE